MALSITPPWRVWPCGFTCFLTMFRPSTTTLSVCGMARETVPCFPLSLPVSNKTVSPFLTFILHRWRGFFSFCFVAISFLYRSSFVFGVLASAKHQRKTLLFSLEHFWRKRNDLHEIALAQLAGDRAKDAGAARIVASG